MGRFEPDLTEVHAFTPIYERGDYEVKLDGRFPFGYTRRDGKEISGMRFGLEMVGRIESDGSLDGNDAGERVTAPRFYVHSKPAFGMLKQFLMAVLGYTRETEGEFNKFFKKHEWWVDGEGDSVTCGNGYEKVVGKRARVTLVKSLYDPGDGTTPKEQQDFQAWRPLTS